MNQKASSSALHQPLFLRSLPFGLLGVLLPIFSRNIGADVIAIGGLFSIKPLILLVVRPIVGSFLSQPLPAPPLPCCSLP